MNQQIYKDNMEALRKRFPGLAEQIENNEYKRDAALVTIENNYEGKPYIYCEKDGVKKILSGKRGAEERADRIFDRWGEINRVTPIYLVGLGDLFLIRNILRKTDSIINIMIYEPSVNIFLEILENINITDLFENRPIGLIINGLNDEETLYIAKSYINLSNVEFVKQYTNVSYADLFPEEVLKYLKIIDKALTDCVVSKNTGIRFSHVEMDNYYHNIKYLCDGSITTQLCDVLPIDVPAIVVSAGPSLNRNIHELKKAKNKAFIIAVDTAVKPLVNAGIIPDMYVVVDGMKPVELLDFEEARQIPLMPSLTSAKSVLENHVGKKIFFFEGSSVAFNLFAMNGMAFSTIACGGSVACSAFSLVYKLGFRCIILVGQDLALTGNKTHADGTFKEKMDIIDTSKCQMVPGNVEELVPTRGDFKLYLDWFNYYIEGCKDVHVINATEGGARIENTEIMTLKDAIERECKKEVNFDKAFEKLNPAFDQAARKRAVEYLNGIPQSFRKLEKEVKKLEKEYKELDKICSRKLDTNTYLKTLKRIKKLTTYIEKHELFDQISSTLSVADYMLMTEQYYEEDNLNDEGKEIARKGILYTKLINKCIELFIPLAEETVGQLK